MTITQFPKSSPLLLTKHNYHKNTCFALTIFPISLKTASPSSSSSFHCSASLSGNSFHFLSQSSYYFVLMYCCTYYFIWVCVNMAFCLWGISGNYFLIFYWFLIFIFLGTLYLCYDDWKMIKFGTFSYPYRFDPDFQKSFDF